MHYSQTCNNNFLISIFFIGKEKTSPRKRSIATSFSRQRSVTEADRTRVEQRRERTLTGEITTPFRSFSRSFHERDRAESTEAGPTSQQLKSNSVGKMTFTMTKSTACLRHLK